MHLLTNRTPRTEYENRWKRAQAVAKANGVEALVVWGKGVALSTPQTI